MFKSDKVWWKCKIMINIDNKNWGVGSRMQRKIRLEGKQTQCIDKDTHSGHIQRYTVLHKQTLKRSLKKKIYKELK